MTKEITKAYILQELADKFKLREFVPSKFLFDETVVPVYNIEAHLQKWLTRFYEASITSGPTVMFFFTVPETERWTIRGYNIVFMAAGAYTVTGALIRRGGAGSPYNIYLDMKLGQSASYAVNLPTPVEMYGGEAIGVYIDSYTSTAALRLYLDYKREELK